MPELNGGVIYQEQYFLRTDCEADTNFYIPDKVIVYSYDLIGTDKVNVKAKIGPGFWVDLPYIFQSGGNQSKITLNLTGGSMSGDYVCELTVLQDWLDGLGDNIGIGQVLVNGVTRPITASFSNYPMLLNDKITITGLDPISDTTTLDIILI